LRQMWHNLEQYLLILKLLGSLTCLITESTWSINCPSLAFVEIWLGEWITRMWIHVKREEEHKNILFCSGLTFNDKYYRILCIFMKTTNILWSCKIFFDASQTGILLDWKEYPKPLRNLPVDDVNSFHFDYSL